MNSNITKLLDYPFDRLRELKSGIIAKSELRHISLALGEPRHIPPAFILEAVKSNLSLANQYPSIAGTFDLRLAIAKWLVRRYKLSSSLLNPEDHILAVSGTREALFSVVQAIVDNSEDDAHVAIPSPFYAIYEGAAIIAGAKLIYLNCTEETNFLPDLDSVSDREWSKCQLLFLCSPNNPTGAVLPESYYKKAISLSDQYGFIIGSDECYSEIYFDDAMPPTGLLEVCQKIGRSDFRNCLVFNSLSKRSSLPGLRSGFVAGDARLIKQIGRYRNYHGVAIPLAIQAASASAWMDEEHVIENRCLYKEKFEAVHKILSSVLDYPRPEASFFLWAKTPGDDQEFVKDLFHTQNVTVLPGSYLARGSYLSSEPNSVSKQSKTNAGQNHVRIALVAEKSECIDAAQRVASFVRTYYPNV